MTMDPAAPATVVAAPGHVTVPTGLTAAEVAERVAVGAVNATAARTSRTLGEILRANVFTFFNALLAALWVVAVLTGRWQNALFGGVIVANAAIGIVQELRAKRTLDRLAVLSAPRARPIRDGREGEVAVEDVVLDDLLVVQAGDQIPVDGPLRAGAGLSVDESLLTGEAEAVAKSPGDELLSGSVVLAGSGRMQATGVGEQAYAVRLAAEARAFTRTRSELQEGTNRILRWIAIGLLVVGPAVLWSQFRAEDNEDWRDTVTGTVGAMVGMVPEGLVLLTTLAFLVATVGLARRQVLVQELPAVEGLARVDVVCLDKTGTLTHGDVAFDHLVPLAGDPAPAAALTLLAVADGGNATARALAAAFPAVGVEQAACAVPFSSARKWSAVRTADGVTWVLGAPEMVLPAPDGAAERDARASADRLAAQGRRVLLLARSARPWTGDAAEPRLPAGLTPVTLVVLAERIREDAAEVLRYFTDQGVALKVISGDNPRTVGAVAAAVGVPGVTGAGDAVDARTLPEDPDELGAALESASVFGRVTPHQKRAMVRALRARGHVVAMTGDGVNDALALKDADVGVAMGNGAPATRAVAQLVLLDGRFAHLPHAVAEGRRVIANVERAANLFLVKNVYSLVLALATVVTLAAYPLEPVQLTLISTLTIGVPGFFLALAPNRRRYVPGFVGRVLRFSVPVGVVTAAAAYAGYAITRWLDPGAGVGGARTTATVVVVAVALWTLAVLARPLTAGKAVLLGAMAGLAMLALSLPTFREDVLLLRPTAPGLLLAAGLGAAGALLVEMVARIGARRPAGEQHRASVLRTMDLRPRPGPGRARSVDPDTATQERP
ncbi:HAD-IC family P-type ATPase [Blastococcus atacamensis]|uniref:HAD-IC family P-type ATPase n=1 Tax=Blastococcus atacamensis TaxID=2070508 RepID=UPI000CEBE126|nr:HAD-IC family P-type ATPase [Blastococcus atacamensis]